MKDPFSTGAPGHPARQRIVRMENAMSFKLVFAAAALGVALSAGSALAYERHYNFREVWGDAVREHGRDEALSATPRDVMRHYPRQLTDDAAHDPSGKIILEGAQ
jgi:hypothetical protein